MLKSCAGCGMIRLPCNSYHIRLWKGVHFGIVPEGVGDEVCIYLWNQPETEQIFRDAKDALEYQVASDRLGDVITQVTVIDRSF